MYMDVVSVSIINVAGAAHVCEHYFKMSLLKNH